MWETILSFNTLRLWFTATGYQSAPPTPTDLPKMVGWQMVLWIDKQFLFGNAACVVQVCGLRCPTHPTSKHYLSQSKNIQNTFGITIELASFPGHTQYFSMPRCVLHWMHIWFWNWWVEPGDETSCISLSRVYCRPCWVQGLWVSTRVGNSYIQRYMWISTGVRVIRARVDLI